MLPMSYERWMWRPNRTIGVIVDRPWEAPWDHAASLESQVKYEILVRSMSLSFAPPKSEPIRLPFTSFGPQSPYPFCEHP